MTGMTHCEIIHITGWSGTHLGGDIATDIIILILAASKQSNST